MTDDTNEMRRFVIVTPVMNGEKFIAGTLASISGQTYGNWVHIVVDGGSTDHTVSIVRESMKTEPRRYLLEGKDRGMYDALFKGFDAAAQSADSSDSEICCWVPADDRLMPWALSTIAPMFDANDTQWVTAMPALWGPEGRLALVIPHAWYPRSLIRLGLFHGRGLGFIQQMSVFFTRGLLNKVPPEAIEKIRSVRLAGDFMLWCELARHAPLRHAMTVVAGFFSHGGNLSTTENDKYYRELKQNGALLLPGWLGFVLRTLFRPVSLLAVTIMVYNSGRRQRPSK